MITKQLTEAANAWFADDKGLPTMDKRKFTCDNRFANLSIPEVAELRRAYHDMVDTMPRHGESIEVEFLRVPR